MCGAGRPPAVISLIFFFFNDTATTEIYTLSLHDALPIYMPVNLSLSGNMQYPGPAINQIPLDRKSTRLNSSHHFISYAVFCLKKKNKRQSHRRTSAASIQIRVETALHVHAAAALLFLYTALTQPSPLFILYFLFFFLNDRRPTEISPFPLHAPLPI